MNQYHRALVVSDVHIGWEESNRDEFHDFLTTEVPSQSPDALIFAGDIFEFWRRSIGTVFTNHNDIVNAIEELSESDIDIVALYGNHDAVLKNTNDEEPVVSEYPWQWENFIRFESDGDEFVALHGHQYDERNRNEFMNEAFCNMDDTVGYHASEVWQEFVTNRPWAKGLFPPFDYFNRRNLGPLTHMANPDVMIDEPDRRERIRNSVENTFDEYAIYGHTHVPYYGSESSNCGSWTGSENTYIRVLRGNVTLQTY